MSPRHLSARKNEQGAPPASTGTTSTFPERATIRTPPQPSFWARLRFKIIAPYLALALILAVAGSFFLARVFAERLHERLLSQLWEAGHHATDEVVYVERELLATLRAIARTEGVAAAVLAGDGDRLHRLIYPIAANAGCDFVEIARTDGRGLYALHRQETITTPLNYVSSPGLPSYGDWEPFQKVLTVRLDDIGDKFAGLVNAPWGPTFYIGGPIRSQGRTVGVVLVGMSLQRLVRRMAGRGDPILGTASSGTSPFAGRPAEVTLYDSQGRVIATTLQDVPTTTLQITPDFFRLVFQGQTGPEFFYPGRGLLLHGETLEEAFGILEARHGEEDMAVFSVALPGYQREIGFIQVSLSALFGLAVLAVILLGLWLSARIVQPIHTLVQAAGRVERGDLRQKVFVRTEDEVGRLAHAFNRMIQGLRIKEYIRDAFGRFVSREVSEALLRGEIRLQGERRTASMLFADIRDFTRLSEEYDPEAMVRILNEYFTAIVEVAQAHGGMVNKFGGDSTLVVFGAPAPHPDHAERALETALEMRRRLAQINAERLTRGEVPIRMGIGINTGEVVAGTVGSPDRLEYTVIGDAVNLSARIQGLNKEFPEYDILISEYTYQALPERERYTMRNLGKMALKGKSEAVGIYAVLGRSESDGPKAAQG
ncbi:MAG: adenylate/guanylate cyclase domain-containing protein [Chloroflexia bacterium]